MKISYFFVLVILGISLLLLANCFGPTPSASCSLSTPIILENQIQVPYEIVVHGNYIGPGDSVDVWFSVIIKVKNTETGIISTYTHQVSKDLYEDNDQYSGYVVFDIANNESFVIGSADIVDFHDNYHYGFICIINQMINLTTAST